MSVMPERTAGCRIKARTILSSILLSERARFPRARLTRRLRLKQRATGSNGVAATASQVTTTVTNDTTQLVHTWTFTASFAITEEGIFDGVTAPTQTTTTQSRINTDTSVTVTSGTGFTKYDFLQWEQEIVQVTVGGGSGTFSTAQLRKEHRPFLTPPVRHSTASPRTGIIFSHTKSFL